jgi:hypothetical protein
MNTHQVVLPLLLLLSGAGFGADSKRWSSSDESAFLRRLNDQAAVWEQKIQRVDLARIPISFANGQVIQQNRESTLQDLDLLRKTILLQTTRMQAGRSTLSTTSAIGELLLQIQSNVGEIASSLTSLVDPGQVNNENIDLIGKWVDELDGVMKESTQAYSVWSPWSGLKMRKADTALNAPPCAPAIVPEPTAP